MKVRFIAPLVILVLIFGFVLSCGKEVEQPIIKKSVKEKEIIDEQIDEVEELVIEEEIIEDVESDKIDDTIKKDYEIFVNEIEDYSITMKAVEYAQASYEIMIDYVDTEKNELTMTKDEVGSRYMELSSKVQSDYFVLAVVNDSILNDKGISNITPDMIKAIDLICQWKEAKEKEFEYTAKYYWGDGAEYDIKADELSNEADDIADEYLNLMNSMYLSVNKE